MSAALAAGMLALGIGVGAAVGPAPEPSQAGDAAMLAARLPLLIHALSSQAPGAAGAPSQSEAAGEEELVPRRRRRHRRHKRAALPAAAEEAPATSGESTSEPSGGGHSPKAGSKGGAAKLPPVTSVWLIELDGGTFAQAAAQPAATPFIHATVLPGGTLLGGWSAVEGQILAAEASAAVATPLGGTPPLLHTIVQPPCPEGSSACAPETPGQLTAADQFLAGTLAQITGTAAYREHGLVVITFASIGVAAQSGLPAGASSATLTSQPPAGVVVMSPFAHPGTHPSVPFDTASPVQSLQKVLHR